MWILPDTYLPSSLSAQDMLESKEDLILLGSSIESSLMSKSKPTALRTWSQRWNRVPWTQLLFTRTLKPSRLESFETQLISSLVAIRASRFLTLGDEEAGKILATYGHSSQRLSGSYDPVAYSSRMSKVTSRSGLTKSSATWKREVSIRRGEYSQRLKQALLTRGSEFISWPTASARDWKDTPGMAATGVNPDGTSRKRIDQLARAVYHRSGVTEGKLNPDWVERFMGVPDGWTDVNCAEEKGCDGWSFWSDNWEEGVPRVATEITDRVDRTRLLGNGVVPQTAAIAWRVLDAELRTPI